MSMKTELTWWANYTKCDIVRPIVLVCRARSLNTVNEHQWFKVGTSTTDVHLGNHCSPDN